MKSCNYILILRRYASATVLAFILMGQHTQMANSAVDRTYEKERLLLARRIEKILITGGVCQSIKDCRQRQLLFLTPTKKGLVIVTYGVSDVDVLHHIAEEAIKVFYTNGKMSIKVEHFFFTKEDELKSFFKWGKPFVTIKLER